MTDLIRIAKGLKASFKNARDYMLSQALLEVEKYTDNYEVLKDINRLYGDIDGKNIEGTLEEFNDLNNRTKEAIVSFLKDEKYCLLSASSFHHGKISWRFVITNRKATLEDNKIWVQKSIDAINLPTGITFDTAPYGKNQKMRMVLSNKDNEKRPLELVVGTLEDTLISYTPDCELMTIPKAPKKTKKKTDEVEPMDNTLLEKLVMNIENNDLSWENWYKVAQAIFNEGGSLDLFLRWSSQSPKYNERESLALWKGLKVSDDNSKLSIGSIYYWSSQSNLKEYEKIILSSVPPESYQYQKIVFEREHFKVMNPPCFVRIHDGTVQYIKQADLRVMYENKYCDNASFITKWFSDPTIRTYEKVVFKPKQTVPSNVFNIFTDFPMTAVQGDTTVMTTLMRILSGNDDTVFEYLENYFAHMIQKPFEKPGVAIIFYSEKQGAGKDTPLDAIGKMLGSEYFLNTEDAENQVFGRFTAHLQKTIFVKIEECEFETNKKNESALLSWITASQRSYEGKGREPITLDDYKRFVMTTNKRVPVNVPESDRRFVLIHSSEERVGDREFWDSIYTELNKPETLQAYYHYLLYKDISNFNIRNRPTTDFYKEVKTTLRPYHAKFFQEQIEVNDETLSFKWKAYDLFNEMKSGLKYELTLTRFGSDMKVYESVLNKVKNSVNYYVFNPNQMKLFLESKSWWVDY